jgi:hypothetical protein
MSDRELVALLVDDPRRAGEILRDVKRVRGAVASGRGR